MNWTQSACYADTVIIYNFARIKQIWISASGTLPTFPQLLLINALHFVHYIGLYLRCFTKQMAPYNYFLLACTFYCYNVLCPIFDVVTVSHFFYR